MNRPLALALPGLVLALAVLVALAARGDNPRVVLRVGGVEIAAELADTPQSRQRGLMHRTRLAPNQGMLLVFPSPQLIRLWMKNTPLALDAGFFDAEGRFLGSVTMPPDDGRRIHQAPRPAVYALEMAAGWFERNGIKPGDPLVFLGGEGGAPITPYPK